MALQGKLEAQVELKSAADKYFNIWRKESHKLPTISSNKIQGVDLHDGDWESHGAVRSWSYTVGNRSIHYRNFVFLRIVISFIKYKSFTKYSYRYQKDYKRINKKEDS